MQDPVEDAPIQENVPEAPSEEKIEAQKKRGRPVGSKDRVTRKKKVIVEEPIAPVEVQETPPEEPKPKKRQVKPRARKEVEVEEKAHAEQLPSPRTTLAEASRMILQLQHMKQNTRRSHIADVYTRRLLAM